MSLLLLPEEWEERHVAAAGPLEPLARSLADDLRPLLSRDIYFPKQKALLSREGGRCPRDGTMLSFDPLQPHEHRCPRCGETYRGELHDRFWIYWYQLWLAERAVHAALLSRLGLGRDFDSFAEAILDGYAERYASYPNVDNVLGPTRLFFSTYLESIWLLQICVATDLIEVANPALANRLRDKIIEPSRAIIAQYDEGGSNRQVWNDAALLAAAMLLEDHSASTRAVFGRSGVASHLENGLLSDGTWYEGENYHLFAHRGLWYGVTLAEVAGLDIPNDLVQRFEQGFAAPFLTALPDFTFPSRRDSQYAVSLRQWRIAEHCELGMARCTDPVLLGALERMYCDDGPRHDTGRRYSSADVERNGPPTSLSRADLSWRALMFARPELPPLEPYAPQSVLLDGQGLAVFRRDAGRVYAALDYGTSGGGHGHPDRLNLLLCDGNTRWLDDFGTGSYVDPSLHWYRSTLAHNAPMLNGVSQRPVDGTLLAYDERPAAGWVLAAADIAASAHVERAIVVTDDYLIDEIRWRADEPVTFDLPIHADLSLSGNVSAPESSTLIGGDGTEDGFRFAHDTRCQRSRGGVVHGEAIGDGRILETWTHTEGPTDWWRLIAPGPPGAGERAFRMLRAKGTSGKVRTVFCWSRAISNVDFADGIRVELRDTSIQHHRRSETGWQLELRTGGARSGIDLAGFRAQPGIARKAEPTATPPIVLSREGIPAAFSLGESHYRRSEEDWAAAGSPSATVTLSFGGQRLRVVVSVLQSSLTFVPEGATNPYDNEHPDINGDGVQLYVSNADRRAGWVLVPEQNSTRVRARPIEGWSADLPISASWSRAGRGYEIVAEIEVGSPTGIDVLVNEKPENRDRRRGQLVLSGSNGEFVYLRGDRQDEDRLIPIKLIDE